MPQRPLSRSSSGSTSGMRAIGTTMSSVLWTGLTTLNASGTLRRMLHMRSIVVRSSAT
jgi:hypothetical protein